MSEKGKEIISNIAYFALVIFISLMIVRYVGQRTEVIGTSMVPTLEDGDQLITDKISYRFREPERFDIIVFPYEPADAFYIKRIIGMPGETIRIEDGKIYVNGEVLKESYGYGYTEAIDLEGKDLVLGEDEYFVLGDNREVSMDSRYEDVGKIHRKQLLGRAFLRIYPFNKFGLLKHQ